MTLQSLDPYRSIRIDCWQKIFVKGGKRQLADCRPTVGQLLADSRPTVDQQSADSFLGELFFTFSVPSVPIPLKGFFKC